MIIVKDECDFCGMSDRGARSAKTGHTICGGCARLAAAELAERATGDGSKSGSALERLGAGAAPGLSEEQIEGMRRATTRIVRYALGTDNIRPGAADVMWFEMMCGNALAEVERQRREIGALRTERGELRASVEEERRAVEEHAAEIARLRRVAADWEAEANLWRERGRLAVEDERAKAAESLASERATVVRLANAQGWEALADQLRDERDAAMERAERAEKVAAAERRLRMVETCAAALLNIPRDERDPMQVRALLKDHAEAIADLRALGVSP